MEVILLKDLEKLGKRGDVVKVKDGYARNYLIPRGLAVKATQSNIKHFRDIEKQRKNSEERKLHIAEQLKEKIEKVKVTIPLKLGESGKAFGRVTSLDIAESLKNKRINIDHHMVILDEEIKETGNYEVEIKLHPAVSARLRVKVVEADG